MNGNTNGSKKADTGSGLRVRSVIGGGMTEMKRIFWIFTCPQCESVVLTDRSHLSTIDCHLIPSNPDLAHFLVACSIGDTPSVISWMYRPHPRASLPYLE